MVNFQEIILEFWWIFSNFLCLLELKKKHVCKLLRRKNSENKNLCRISERVPGWYPGIISREISEEAFPCRGKKLSKSTWDQKLILVCFR